MIIRRKYPELEQKEFGIASGTKKLINKTKNNLANKVLGSIKKDLNKHAKLENEIEKDLKNSAKRESIMKNLGKEAKRNNITIIKGHKSDKNHIFDDDRYLISKNFPKESKSIFINAKAEDKENQYRKIGKALIKGDAIVNKHGQTQLAHELGHFKNRNEKLTKKVSELNDKLVPEYKMMRGYRS